LVARDDEFQYGEDQWDLIVMTYVRDWTQEDAAKVWRALRRGGMVAYELCDSRTSRPPRNGTRITEFVFSG
jgi:hypothetical protein